MTLADVNKMIERSSGRSRKALSRRSKLSTTVRNLAEVVETHKKALVVAAVLSLAGAVVLGSLVKKHFNKKS